mmetsp:Transcript_23424/g.50122  ORF Transcript_23424/g.50122 Transcript_23424/m.50122 type:complete len:208 (+) Transcript_23424:360-983(+)
MRKRGRRGRRGGEARDGPRRPRSPPPLRRAGPPRGAPSARPVDAPVRQGERAIRTGGRVGEERHIVQRVAGRRGSPAGRSLGCDGGRSDIGEQNEKQQLLQSTFRVERGQSDSRSGAFARDRPRSESFGEGVAPGKRKEEGISHADRAARGARRGGTRCREKSAGGKESRDGIAAPTMMNCTRKRLLGKETLQFVLRGCKEDSRINK